MRHELKTLPEYFQALAEGRKTFEIRKNDRNFEETDILELKEWNPAMGFTGNFVIAEVNYILSSAPEFGLMEGFVIMSLSIIRVKNRGIDLIIHLFTPAPAPENPPQP